MYCSKEGRMDCTSAAVLGLTWVIGGVGIVIIVRRLHMFSWFRSVNAIPDEFIRKSISLRGEVKGITSDNTLSVMHIPTIQTPSYKKFASQTPSPKYATSEGYLPVSISGVAFRPGSREWLKDNLAGANIQLVPLRINQQAQLDSIIYMRKRWTLKTCVNEELVRQGVAVTGHCQELETHKLYQRMFGRLLRAEVNAEKKGKGIWVRPSLMERAKETLGSAVQWVKTKISKRTTSSDQGN